VRDFVGQYGSCRFVLTSRPAGLSASARRVLTELGQLGHTAVRPLDDVQIRHFVRAWYGALLGARREDARARAEDLLARIQRATHLGELARTPIQACRRSNDRPPRAPRSRSWMRRTSWSSPIRVAPDGLAPRKRTVMLAGASGAVVTRRGYRAGGVGGRTDALGRGAAMFAVR
jgi:hypothetical protein